MKNGLDGVGAAALAAALLLTSAPSWAGIEACGDIDVEAGAECEMKVQADCKLECEPIHFRAACSARLYAECSGMCDANVEASCTSSCQGSCEADCEVDPGRFDCSASCEANCDASCVATCDAEAADGEAEAECEASCMATCAGECEAGCEANPPNADCEAQCNGCCTGECSAEANIDCQIDCQAEGSFDCQAELEVDCKAECDKPKGALFCDGQYVDHDGNLEECVNALRALIDVRVDGYAYGDSSCEGGSCSAEGEAGGSVSCTTTGPGLPSGGAAFYGVLPLLGAAFLRRRGKKRHLIRT